MNLFNLSHEVNLNWLNGSDSILTNPIEKDVVQNL